EENMLYYTNNRILIFLSKIGVKIDNFGNNACKEVKKYDEKYYPYILRYYWRNVRFSLPTGYYSIVGYIESCVALFTISMICIRRNHIFYLIIFISRLYSWISQMGRRRVN